MADAVYCCIMQCSVLRYSVVQVRAAQGQQLGAVLLATRGSEQRFTPSTFELH